MDDGFTVNVANGVVEAGCAVEFALWVAVCMEVGKVGPGTYGTSWCFGAAEVVVAKAKTMGALGDSVTKVWGDPEVSAKVEETLQGSGGGGVSHNGYDLEEAFFPTLCSSLVSQWQEW